MTESSDLIAPRARRQGVVSREVGNEVVVFARDSSQAHYLSPDAALIWKKCDGQTTIAELAAVLGEANGRPASTEFVWESLLQLGELGLLEEEVSWPRHSGGISRRTMLLRVGAVVGGGVALPLISSIPVALADSCNSKCSASVGGVGNGSGDCASICGKCFLFTTDTNLSTGVYCKSTDTNCKCAIPGTGTSGS